MNLPAARLFTKKLDTEMIVELGVTNLPDRFFTQNTLPDLGPIDFKNVVKFENATYDFTPTRTVKLFSGNVVLNEVHDATLGLGTYSGFVKNNSRQCEANGSFVVNRIHSKTKHNVVSYEGSWTNDIPSGYEKLI